MKLRIWLEPRGQLTEPRARSTRKDKLTMKTINTRVSSQETLGKEGRKTGTQCLKKE